MNIREKKKKLEKILRDSKRILIAYSGGVDSTFLLKFAVDCLGTDSVAVFIEKAEVYPDEEIKFARDFAKSLGVKIFEYRSEKLKYKKFVENSKFRCFYCKKDLFSKMLMISKKNGFNTIADGSNYDDLTDYRPGNKAKSMYGVISPLQLAGFNKNDIRKLSRKMGLPTWDKPQMACLASRIPYGEKITRKRLERIDKAERHLKKLGFGVVRVRDYDSLCRIEVDPSEIQKAVSLKEEILRTFKKIGYQYITVDLEGYITGSMNKTIT